MQIRMEEINSTVKNVKAFWFEVCPKGIPSGKFDV